MTEAIQTKEDTSGKEKTRGAVAQTIEHSGKIFEVDEHKFLLRFSDYCEEWVDYVKDQEGIGEITDEHRVITDVTRGYYEKNGIAPMALTLSNMTNLSVEYMNTLYPLSGLKVGSCKMAGISKLIGRF
jgi:dissimilatory sulfite reductase related protein